MDDKQIPQKYIDIINDEVSISNKSCSITDRNKIPDTSQIPLDNPTYWLRIPDVICVFVDMIGSTKLSAGTHPNSTAKSYRLFTNTIVRIFDEIEAPYIDIKGDGVFALFDKDQVYRSFVAAVIAKTVVHEKVVPRIKELTTHVTGAHIGIDQKTLLVRRLGFRRVDGRTDRQNEVWAGKPVNMASKLASLTGENELLVSERYYGKISDEHVRKSCGCVGGQPGGEKEDLWKEIDIQEDSKFDFKKAYKLKSIWCPRHGAEFIGALLKLDGN